MAQVTAKDVQALRQATGAGILDCKRALEENDGDMEAAKQWLREKGLAGAAKRADREATQGAVAISVVDRGASIVELRCETDFVAMSDGFVALDKEIAQAVATKGEAAAGDSAGAIDELKTTLKENISLGRVVHYERPIYLRREDVPEAEVTAERATVEAISRNEGKPEAALPKVVEGRMNGWFKERCLLEQPYARDEKRTIADLIGSAEIVRFAQVVVGG